MEEKKQIEDAKNNCTWILCDLHQFFNLKQTTPNIYDIRLDEHYKKSHVNMARNIAEPLQLKQFTDVLCYPVVIYGNKENTTKQIINHLYKISRLTALDDTLPFYVFDGEYKDIYNKYPFLCGISILSYPNMILKDELFIGNASMSENKRIITDLGINYIVNVTETDYDLEDDIKQNIQYLKLSIDDLPIESDRMGKYFEIANKFMDNALLNNNKNKKNKILVHCEAGRSRSATIIIAYLMKSRKYSLCNAYIHVKKCRPRIKPNNGFLNKLIEYEQIIFGQSTKKELSEAMNSDEITLFFDC
eukprot:100317_1